MRLIEMREAKGDVEIAEVRELMRAYGEYLRSEPSGSASICIEGYERELGGLPGEYAAPDGALLLARVEGEAAGCVAVRPIVPVAGAQVKGRECEMKRLWVGGRFRGLGLGRRLVEAAVSWGRERGYGWMYLDTVPAAMPEANRLYEAVGFERVERYNDNRVADVVFYRRPL